MDHEKSNLINKLINEGFLKSEDVIKAFRVIPRENFVLDSDKKYAYLDIPLPINFRQTISQPLTVAFMTELLDAKHGQKILEIGTGSGYQASLLSHIVGKKGIVYTTEIIPQLAEFSKKNLENAGIKNVKVIHSDGSRGLKEHAPYDRIIVTSAAPKIPESLKKQLKIRGKMVIPVGEWVQTMKLVKKISKDNFKTTDYGEFRFVPLMGDHGWK